ncbi:hypothetical protein HKCCE2091_02995 [Rhodobacterales bacterium HKCCE2091]|nr:hypothetical protein [Rhodobacterales bacterium HKCCE2091]
MKKITTIAAIAAVATMTELPQPASAHHSAAMFDDEINLQLEGTVTRFDYLNPHSWLYVDVRNEDGTTTEWGFELAAPPRLRRVGVSPNYWEPGDEVQIVTHPLRDGRPAGDLAASRNLTKENEFGNVELIEAAAE